MARVVARNKSFTAGVATAGGILLTIAGCQRTIAPVSGRIMLNGKPLAGATITFQPKATRAEPRPAGTGSVGHTDAQGRYSLHMVEPSRAGAVVGIHTVTISTSSDAPEAAQAKPNPLPAIWRDGSQQYRVPPGGTAKANFDITVKEPPAVKAKTKRPR